MLSQNKARILAIFTSVPALASVTIWGTLPRSSSIRTTPAAATEPLESPKAAGFETQVREADAKRALSFEANHGQTDSRVQFLARGSGYTLFFTPREAVLTLRNAANPRSATQNPRLQAHPQSGIRSRESAVLRMQLVGANPEPQVTGLDERPGRSNYFIGRDPQNWRTDIPHYGKVKCEGVYPGVDVIYYGNGRQLEYDFVVAAGADPAVIRISFAGAEQMRLDGDGELVLGVAGGEIRQQKPVIYQEVAGVKREVAGRYVMKGDNQVGIEVAAYDAGRPLVIDPVLVYSSYLGGSSIDDGIGIAVDSDGHAYVSGRTESTGFPITPGAFQTANAGGSDAFVTKLAPDGEALIYSTYLGGSSFDQGRGIAVDRDGHAYVTGRTESTDFPITPGAFQTANAGGSDAFVTKLSHRGTALIYSTYLGGSSGEIGLGIALDRNGQAHVTGSTDSTDFPTTPGAFQTTAPGSGDAYVAKLNRRGTALDYSTYLGGSIVTPSPRPGGEHGDFGRGITVDSEGHAFVTGDTDSADFPTTPDAFQTANAGGLDAFVTKLNRRGSDLVYSTYLGGSDLDFGLAIAVDRGGRAHVSGRTDSIDFPTTPGAFQTAYAGGSDAFVTKLNRRGTAPVYSTYLGGSDFDQSDDEGIALDRDGHAYVSGFTGSTDFPTTPGALQTANAGAPDVFVTKLTRRGTALVYSTYLGGSNHDVGGGIEVDRDGRAYVTGITFSADFPTTPGAFQTAFAGSIDAFVAKIASDE